MGTEEEEAAAEEAFVAAAAESVGKGVSTARVRKVPPALRVGKGPVAARAGKTGTAARGGKTATASWDSMAATGEGEAFPVSGGAPFAAATRSTEDPFFGATPRSSFSGSPMSFPSAKQAPWMRSPGSDPAEWDRNPIPPGGFMNMFQEQPAFGENSHLVGRTAHYGPFVPPRPCEKSPLVEEVSNKSPPTRTLNIDIDNEQAGRTDKRIIWTRDEDYRLMSSWLKNSMDSISGTDKRNEQYWSDVANAYNLTTPSHRKRNMKQVKDRWHKINKWIDLFHSAWLKSRRVNTSGWNDQMWIDAAHKFYESENKDMKLGPFVLMDVWNLVRNEPKWITYNDGLKKARKRKASNLQEEEGREEVDDIEDVDVPRPIGQKEAKKAAYAARFKHMSSSSDDENVQVLKDAQATRLKVLQVQEKISAERLESSKLAREAAKEQKEAKLAEKEVKNLEIKGKMLDTYNFLLTKDVVLMTSEEKAEHVAELKFLRRTLFPQLN